VCSSDLNRSLDSVKQQYQQQFGELYSSLVQEDKLRQQVLDDLVQRSALDQAARDEGMAVSDEQLRQLIESQRMFQDKGQFSVQRYEQILTDNRFTKERFEAQQRQFMVRNQYEGIVGVTEIVTDKELQQLAGLEIQEREVGYLRVDHRPFLENSSVSDAQMQQYFKDNQSQFQIPERVTVNYVRLKADNIAIDPITDAEVKTYYDANPDKVELPERRNVRHILIRLEDPTDVVAEKKASDMAQALLAQLKSGSDFAKLAKEKSQDPGSATQGGELGFFQRGDMVTPFEDAAFALKKAGDLSDVVKTNFGFHILQLIETKVAERPAFEQVKALLLTELKNERAMKLYQTKLDTLKTLAFEQDDSLEPVAKALGLSIELSPAFTAEGAESIFAAQPVLDAAFSAQVLQEKRNSAVIEVDTGDAIVLRLNHHEPEKAKDFAEVKAEIQRLLARQEAIKQAEVLAVSLMSQAKQTSDPAQLVKAGIEWMPSQWINRNADAFLPEVTSAAFKAPKTKEGKASWTLHRLATGDSLLVRVSGVRYDEDKSARVMSEMKQAADQVFAEAMVDALSNSIKEKAKIELLVK
jgi:peptidyl-prolyl cis-trans isomerase D